MANGFLTTEPIDTAPLVADCTRDVDGAVVVFLGVVRNHADGRDVARMRYDAYTPMAETEMEAIAAEIALKWPEARLRMLHRTGLLEIGETSVAIVVASPHRGEAFEACRHAIERIKASVPIWKKEFGPMGESWVDGTSEVDPAPRPPGGASNR